MAETLVRGSLLDLDAAFSVLAGGGGAVFAAGGAVLVGTGADELAV